MGNGCNNQIHPQNMYQRSSFLPILCRLSIKDVTLSQYTQHPSSDEPSSPKVSCMGQVKRNNRVTGFPPPYRLTSTAASSPSNHIIHTRLRKFFSSKNLIATASPSSANNRSVISKSNCSATAIASREIKRCGTRKLQAYKNGDCKINYNGRSSVEVGELDPPLPVVKKVPQPGGGRDEINLWKRRFGGGALKSLQIQQIHLPDKNCHPPTTV